MQIIFLNKNWISERNYVFLWHQIFETTEWNETKLNKNLNYRTNLQLLNREQLFKCVFFELKLNNWTNIEMIILTNKSWMKLLKELTITTRLLKTQDRGNMYSLQTPLGGFLAPPTALNDFHLLKLINALYGVPFMLLKVRFY